MKVKNKLGNRVKKAQKRDTKSERRKRLAVNKLMNESKWIML